MKSNLILYTTLLLILISNSPITAQSKKNKPAWVDAERRESIYPSSIYVKGLGTELNLNDDELKDLRDRASSSARSQVVESIHVQIKSITTSNIIIEDTETTDFFRRTSISLSKVEISGLKEETWYDEKAEVFYTFAYAKKANISSLYTHMIASKKNEVENHLKNAAKFETVGDQQNALRSYYECIPIFREIEEAQTLIMFFESLPITAPKLHVEAVNDYKQKVSENTHKVLKNNELTLDDVCYFMAYALDLQTKSEEREMRLINYTFEDSKMGSTFSKRLGSVMEQKLVHQGFAVTTGNVQPGIVEDKYILDGTYWKEDDKLKIISVLRESETGKAVASAEGLLPVDWLTKNNIGYKPDNYDRAKNTDSIFHQNTVEGQGGLKIDILTNHGHDNLIYSKGDTMKLYITANRECYVRFIYHMADGTKVLLLDNYFIPSRLVNQMMQIPNTFECVEPFGAETLQMNAQAQPFQPLNTHEQYGFKFIQDDLPEILANTRGMKLVKEVKLRAEKKLMITTLPY